jgi:uncharacterized protein (TIGR00255 family)
MAISSMTGFGRAETDEDGRRLSIEIKSVNHKYLDLSIKEPRKLSFLEPLTRDKIKNSISRGKVEIQVTFQANSDNAVSVVYNANIAGEYIKSARLMAERYGISPEIKASDIMSLPNVFDLVENEDSEELLTKLYEKTLDEAVKNFCQSREKEGERLKADLLEKLKEMSEIVARIEVREPEIIKEYEGKLDEKVKEVLADSSIDESRILEEVTIYTDRIAIDEEIVRLKSHVKEATDTLTNESAVGRKMDFLAQEMNREANTILSKSTDPEVAHEGVLLKTLIEKIREQVQNLE